MLTTLRFFSVVMAVLIFTSGCGIKAKAHLARRERVDQDVEYYPGAAATTTPAPKKTRQVIVVEVTRDKKEKPQAEKAVVEPKAEVEEPEVPSAKSVQEKPKVLPTPRAAVMAKPAVAPSEPVSPAPEKSSEVTTYTVQKDDTLQKIAKELLGSYGQWTKIYEANRDKIKDPNFLKTGTVLTIPK